MIQGREGGRGKGGRRYVEGFSVTGHSKQKIILIRLTERGRMFIYISNTAWRLINHNAYIYTILIEIHIYIFVNKYMDAYNCAFINYNMPLFIIWGI